MNPVFEHDDLKKSGRAVIILSIMLMLVGSCTENFTQFAVLDVEVQFGQADLKRLLSLLLAFYSLIFAVRVFQADPVQTYRVMQKKLSDELNQRHSFNSDWQGAQISRLNTTKQEQERNVSDRDLRAKIAQEHNDKVNVVRAKASKMDARTQRLIRIRRQLDFGATITLHYALPCIFIGLALLVDVQPVVCPEPSEIRKAA
ncbi:MAG: hypothetical protein HKN18_03620 [Silicimonas sp.]|nr:hypothetical protein [Silicimonas sp.]